MLERACHTVTIQCIGLLYLHLGYPLNPYLAHSSLVFSRFDFYLYFQQADKNVKLEASFNSFDTTEAQFFLLISVAFWQQLKEMDSHLGSFLQDHSPLADYLGVRKLLNLMSHYYWFFTPVKN